MLLNVLKPFTNKLLPISSDPSTTALLCMYTKLQNVLKPFTNKLLPISSDPSIVTLLCR